MRPSLVFRCACLAGLLAASPVSAQDHEQHPYQLDPYKPSDAALLRTYGATLVSQTPVSELRHLDPYKPSHAALLRLGGAIPVWAAVWPEWPVAAVPIGRVYQPEVVFERRKPRRERAVEAPGLPEAVAAPQTGPTSVATLRRPESNDGIWIEYDGRRWVADGRAVPLVEGRFTRIGDRGGDAVYRETAGAGERIFIATADDLVAPFRPR